MQTRCQWLDTTKADYVDYHDNEWGVPVYDDKVLFEFLVLESAQAGLNWYTILKRRDAYRQAFANFDPAKVALFDQDKIEMLLNNSGIIRHRAKIEAAINNAQCVLAIQQEMGSLSHYLWGFVNHQPIINIRAENSPLITKSAISDAMAKDMKKRGFKFLGSVTLYAFMQACGMVNDHDITCFKRHAN